MKNINLSELEKWPVAGEKTTPGQSADGIYLVLKDGKTLLFDGSPVSDSVKQRCIGVGVKEGAKAIVVSLRDVCKNDTALTINHCPGLQQGEIDTRENDASLTTDRGGRFIQDWHEAAADWDGQAGTDALKKNLRPNIKLGKKEFIPSLGQLYFIYLHFNEINKALEAVGGQKLQETWYWSSTECNDPGAWVLSLYCGTMIGSTKATYRNRVRPVSAFLSANVHDSVGAEEEVEL